MQDQENEKNVSSEGNIKAEVSKNRRPTWDLVGQTYESERQGQKEYEPKKIKSSTNKLVQIRGASVKRGQRALKRRNIYIFGPLLVRKGAEAHHDYCGREQCVDADQRQD
jgi:hypothetical protein